MKVREVAEAGAEARATFRHRNGIRIGKWKFEVFSGIYSSFAGCGYRNLLDM